MGFAKFNLCQPCCVMRCGCVDNLPTNICVKLTISGFGDLYFSCYGNSTNGWFGSPIVGPNLTGQQLRSYGPGNFLNYALENLIAMIGCTDSELFVSIGAGRPGVLSGMVSPSTPTLNVIKPYSCNPLDVTAVGEIWSGNINFNDTGVIPALCKFDNPENLNVSLTIKEAYTGCAGYFNPCPGISGNYTSALSFYANSSLIATYSDGLSNGGATYLVNGISHTHSGLVSPWIISLAGPGSIYYNLKFKVIIAINEPRVTKFTVPVYVLTSYDTINCTETIAYTGGGMLCDKCPETFNAIGSSPLGTVNISAWDESIAQTCACGDIKVPDTLHATIWHGGLTGLPSDPITLTLNQIANPAYLNPFPNGDSMYWYGQYISGFGQNLIFVMTEYYSVSTQSVGFNLRLLYNNGAACALSYGTDCQQYNTAIGFSCDNFLLDTGEMTYNYIGSFCAPDTPTTFRVMVTP
jgi:hypothetical protein